MARRARLEVQSIERPYSDAERTAILAAIELKGISPRDFLDEVELAVRWGGMIEEVDAGRGEPSTRERENARIADLAAKLLQALQVPVPADLVKAGQDLAQEGTPPPHARWGSIQVLHVPSGEVKPRDIAGCPATPTMAVWNVEGQLREVRRALPWLEQVAARAAATARSEKAVPGNRAAGGLAICVAALVKLFRECSASPGKAYKNGYDYEAHGNLIDFLEIVLRPLGFDGDRMALLRLVEKASRSAPPELPRPRRRTR